MTTFRPNWLPRRADIESLPEDDEGPRPQDIRFVRALALYAVVFWLAIGGAALWCWP